MPWLIPSPSGFRHHKLHAGFVNTTEFLRQWLSLILTAMWFEGWWVRHLARRTALQLRLNASHKSYLLSLPQGKGTPSSLARYGRSRFNQWNLARTALRGAYQKFFAISFPIRFIRPWRLIGIRSRLPSPSLETACPAQGGKKACACSGGGTARSRH